MNKEAINILISYQPQEEKRKEGYKDFAEKDSQFEKHVYNSSREFTSYMLRVILGEYFEHGNRIKTIKLDFKLSERALTPDEIEKYFLSLSDKKEIEEFEQAKKQKYSEYVSKHIFMSDSKKAKLRKEMLVDSVEEFKKNLITPKLMPELEKNDELSKSIKGYNQRHYTKVNTIIRRDKVFCIFPEELVQELINDGINASIVSPKYSTLGKTQILEIKCEVRHVQKLIENAKELTEEEPVLQTLRKIKLKKQTTN